MPVEESDTTSGNPPKPEGHEGKAEINLQELAERILDLLKKDARIEQERLGKRDHFKTRR